MEILLVTAVIEKVIDDSTAAMATIWIRNFRWRAALNLDAPRITV